MFNGSCFNGSIATIGRKLRWRKVSTNESWTTTTIDNWHSSGSILDRRCGRNGYYNWYSSRSLLDRRFRLNGYYKWLCSTPWRKCWTVGERISGLRQWLFAVPGHLLLQWLFLQWLNSDNRQKTQMRKSFDNEKVHMPAGKRRVQWQQFNAEYEERKNLLQGGLLFWRVKT